jgi:uncharacterized membrane protein
MKTEPRPIYRLIFPVFMICIMSICFFIFMLVGPMNGAGLHEYFFNVKHEPHGYWFLFFIPFFLFFIFMMIFRSRSHFADMRICMIGSSEENTGTAKNDNSRSGNENAFSILKLRLAKGEINHEEYKLMEKILRG